MVMILTKVPPQKGRDERELLRSPTCANKCNKCNNHRHCNYHLHGFTEYTCERRNTDLARMIIITIFTCHGYSFSSAVVPPTIFWILFARPHLTVIVISIDIMSIVFSLFQLWQWGSELILWIIFFFIISSPTRSRIDWSSSTSTSCSRKYIYYWILYIVY